ncbi:MAG: hypothetical protein AB8B74_09145 [Crocinitomicaceae bacterium]
MKHYYLYIFVLLAFASCKKVKSELEGTNQPIPIYKVSGLINGDSLNLTVNGTTALMSHGTGSLNGVGTYYTKFENKETNQIIKFSLTEPEIKSEDISNYSTSNKDIKFLTHQSNCYNFNYSSPPQDSPLLMILSNEGNWIHNTTLTFNEYGIYEVPLRFKAFSSQTFYHTIEHGFEPNHSADFSLENTVTDIKFTSFEKNNNHSWYLDGELIGTAFDGFFTVKTGLHEITHTITDKIGNTVKKSHIFYSHYNQLKWILNTNKCYPTMVENNFERAIISYQENGVVYSSEHAEENEDHVIKITDIEYFIENQNNGKISFKFTASFSGTLLSPDLLQKKKLTNFTATCKYVIQ